MMYFHVHPVKVFIIELGQVPKKVKYIRVQGDEMEDCFASFSEKIRLIVNQEANNTEFYCSWIDYANDEIMIQSLDDFWIWTRFLECNLMFHPEIVIKPVFQVPPAPRPMMHAFVAPGPVPINRPQFAQPRFYRPIAQTFYPARYTPGQPPRQNALEPARPLENGYHGSPVGTRDDSDYMNEDTSPLPTVIEVDNSENHLSPVEMECLIRLEKMGYADKSGWLVNVVQQVDGDFKKALAIVEEEADTTDIDE